MFPLRLKIADFRNRISTTFSSRFCFWNEKRMSEKVSMLPNSNMKGHRRASMGLCLLPMFCSFYCLVFLFSRLWWICLQLWWLRWSGEPFHWWFRYSWGLVGGSSLLRLKWQCGLSRFRSRWDYIPLPPYRIIKHNLRFSGHVFSGQASLRRRRWLTGSWIVSESSIPDVAAFGWVRLFQFSGSISVFC